MKDKIFKICTYTVFTVLAVLFVIPLVLVFINSFKSRLFISVNPFALPVGDMFAGFENYVNGFKSSGFLMAFLRSAFITVASVIVINICSSMTAWYIIRVHSKLTTFLYYAFVFSMVVPFQMVMYTITFIVSQTHFNNCLGIVFVYLGFGAGLSVFMFCGFIKSIPSGIEEAAEIDGSTPVQTFFLIILPMLRPISVTVAILNSMWIWNDYLLPYLTLGTRSKTIPVAIQIAMQGAYGATDYGGLMAMLVFAIIPIIIFYITSQKYIIKGVIAGAVKG